MLILWRSCRPGSLSLLAAPARPNGAAPRARISSSTARSPKQALRQRILLLEDFDRLLRIADRRSCAARARTGCMSTSSTAIDAAARRSSRSRPASPAIYTATPDGIAAFVDGRAEAAATRSCSTNMPIISCGSMRPDAYPAWYVEGFAEYFMTVRFGRARDRHRQFHRAAGLSRSSNGRWLPMDAGAVGQPMGLERETSSVYYAQSWLLDPLFLQHGRAAGDAAAAISRDARRSDPRAALLPRPA